MMFIVNVHVVFIVYCCVNDVKKVYIKGGDTLSLCCGGGAMYFRII